MQPGRGLAGRLQAFVRFEATQAELVSAQAIAAALTDRAIAITGVKFTQKEPQGGYFKLNAATKRNLESCEHAEYDEYK